MARVLLVLPTATYRASDFLDASRAVDAEYVVPAGEDLGYPARRVGDGDTIEAGPIVLRVIHTPGHTQGSISLWIPTENKLIAGDTLFRDSIGRTDLPGGNPRQILRSIEDKLLGLPEETVVVPGHGPNTTIGREKERNPFLQGL